MLLDDVYEDVRKQYEIVQNEINDIIIYQKDDKLKRKELISVLEGYIRFLKDKGFGGLEIPMFLKQLDLVVE